MYRLKKRVITLLRKHHYWREVGFDELSELYIGMMFRSLSLSIIGVFIPLYLLNLGYPILSIAIIFGWHYTVKIFCDMISAKTILVIGPKHTILVSYLFQILMLLLFLTLPTYHWPLALLGGLWGLSNSLFWLAFHVDFSKIKHLEHSGKEMSIVQSAQRIGYAVGPVVGGLLATVLGPQYAFLTATLILFLGIWPLLSTHEQVKMHRELDFRQFSFKLLWRDQFTFAALCLEDIASSFYWPLFLSVFVLKGFVYAELGIITTVGFVLSLLAAKMMGQLTDRHKGRGLLQGSMLGLSATYLLRPFLPGALTAGVLNGAYEVLTVGFNLPYYKGLYDNADRFGENRVEYFMLLESVSTIIRALVCWTVVLFLGYFNSFVTLSLVFALAAVACCAVLAEKFDALD